MQGKGRKFVLLSFDVEEFDIPLNYHQVIGSVEQFETGQRGLLNLMNMLSTQEQVKCTFFTTSLFAEYFPQTIRSISSYHEIGSHTCSNSAFQTADMYISKRKLEQTILGRVYGL